MRELYLVRHSAPFVKIKDIGKIAFSEFCNVDCVYSSNSSRSTETAKYITSLNNLELIVDDRLNEREFGIKYIDELPEDFIYK